MGDSFNNFGTGPQNFENSVINSDSCSCVRLRNGSRWVVDHGGRGPQNFSGAIINGVQVQSTSQASSSYGWQTTRSEFHCAGTSRSFNNHGRGSSRVVYHGGRGPQYFSGAIINGVQVQSASRASSSYGWQTTRSEIHCAGTCRSSFNNHGRGFQNFGGAVINSGRF